MFYFLVQLNIDIELGSLEAPSIVSETSQISEQTTLDDAADGMRPNFMWPGFLGFETELPRPPPPVHRSGSS